LKVQQEDEEILTSGPLARELVTTTQTIKRWLEEGKLKAIVTSSGQRLFRRSDIEAFKRARAKKL
jgi:excisionase family DNA binding protein